jgi:uncharacterized repeat protein (TIGR03803 family)
MKACIKNLFSRLGGASCAAWVLPALIAGLGLISAGRVTAQTFTTLHTFTGSDGTGPQAGLILSGNTLYGVASSGGSSGRGTVFAMNIDGSGFTNLHSFSPITDGANPSGNLILSGNTLYGTATNGGNFLYGTVFKVNTDGSGFTKLHSFTGSYVSSPPGDGARPKAGLVLSSNTLYGVASGGGSIGYGTVFKLNTNGTGFMVLHDFIGSDGDLPIGGLVLSGNTLYGTAYDGFSSAASSNGTVFAINTDGTGFTNLHYFTGGGGSSSGFTNTGGAFPDAGLILSGDTLYGTTSSGGAGSGTVFALKTNGTSFTILHTFSANPLGTNEDGANPAGTLILSGTALYGAANLGGTLGQGTVFSLRTNGTFFTTLHSFSYSSDGTHPAELILVGNNIYGTANGGGSFGYGTIFSLSLPPPPQLTIIRSAENVIVRWPTNAVGFNLQTTTNLVPPAVWITNSPSPAVVNGQNTVTNLISGTQKYYRLSQ